MLIFPLIVLGVSNFVNANSWWRTYGGPGNQEGFCVQQTKEGDYVVASFENANTGILKLNTNGDTVWLQPQGLTQTNYIQQTSEGEYVISGFQEQTSDGIVVIKTDSLGSTMWKFDYRRVGFFAGGYCVKDTPDGGYVAVGSVLLKLDDSGKLVWLREYDGIGQYVGKTSDGGFIVCGYQGDEWNRQLWILRTDSRGKIEWERLFGPICSVGYAVHQTSDGGFLIGASGSLPISGTWGILFLKVNPQGDSLWTRVYDDKGQDYCLSMEPTSDGNYIASGYTTSFGAGSNDAWFMKIDPQGNVKWKRYWAGPGDDAANYACQTSDVGYIITGYTTSFGAKGKDLLLIKTDAYGNLPIEISPTSILNLWYENLSFDSLKPKARFINKSSSRYNYDVYYHCSIVGFDNHEADRHDSVLVKGGHDAWKAVDIEFPVWTAVHPSAYKATFWATGTVGHFPSEPMSITFYKKSAVEEPESPPSPSVEFVQTMGTELILRYSNCPSGFRAEIFDASGRKVDELRSESRNGVLSWGSGHSSGVYFLRFSEGESTRILKAAIIH